MHDYVTKSAWYKESGVKEYWVVDGWSEMITVHILGEDQKY